MSDCLFCKIIAGDIPSKKVYEDESVYAFYDIDPQAPTHFLVIPKEHIKAANRIDKTNEATIGHIFSVIANLTSVLGFSDGYRVVTNCGKDAGQTVEHLHFHVLGGKELGSFN